MTGAAQNIKMILCSATTDSEMILCYNYFYEMRKNITKPMDKKVLISLVQIPLWDLIKHFHRQTRTLQCLYKTIPSRSIKRSSYCQ